MTTTAEIPELYAVVLAYTRVKEVERIRSEVGDALALACWEASQVATAGLIARTIGVSRPRVAELIDKGKALAEPTKRKGSKK